MYNERLGAHRAALLVFIGFNVTFFTQFILGTQGMPRRYYDYLPEFQLLHQVSTVGSWILGLGLFMVAVHYLHRSLKTARRRPANPWGGVTLEWQTATPADRAQLPRRPRMVDRTARTTSRRSTSTGRQRS